AVTNQSPEGSRLPVTNLDNFLEARFWITSCLPTTHPESGDDAEQERRKSRSLQISGTLLVTFAAYHPSAYPISRGSAPPNRKPVAGSITMPLTRPSSSFTTVIS